MANRTQLEAEGPLVDVEMRSQLEEAKTRRSEGESDLRATKAAIERLDEKLSDLKIDTNLLDQQEKVEKLTSQTGGYEEKEEDLPGLKVRAATIRRNWNSSARSCPLRVHSTTAVNRLSPSTSRNESASWPPPAPPSTLTKTTPPRHWRRR